MSLARLECTSMGDRWDCRIGILEGWLYESCSSFFFVTCYDGYDAGFPKKMGLYYILKSNFSLQKYTNTSIIYEDDTYWWLDTYIVFPQIKNISKHNYYSWEHLFIESIIFNANLP